MMTNKLRNFDILKDLEYSLSVHVLAAAELTLSRSARARLIAAATCATGAKY